MSDETADYLTSVDTLTTDLPSGHTITIKDITESEEAEISESAETEDEMIELVIDEYLIDPDLNASDMPMSKRQEVFIAIQRKWGGVDHVQSLMDEMQVSGNRR